MEFKRDSVIALYLDGKPQVAIVRALQHLNVNKSFVSRTIARYRETGSVAKRHGGGHKKTATSTEMIRKVKARIERNPRRSGRDMARELNISLERMQYILKNELGLQPLKFEKIVCYQGAAHPISPAAKESSRGKAQKKDAKKIATKTKRSKKIIKAPEDEAPEDDVLQEDEFKLEEDKEEDQDPMPEPEPEVKAKKPIKSKRSRKQLKDDIPPIEEEVADIKEDIPESQDSEEEVKKPRGSKPAAKKASISAAGAKNVSKKTPKAKKITKAESAKESVSPTKSQAS